MPIPELVKFRQKYPQYGDVEDATLASKLAQKYPDAYGDLPSKVQSPNIPELRAMPPTMARLKPMTIQEQAEAQNIGAISRISGQRLSDVARQYQGKLASTGLRREFPIGMYRDPTYAQLLHMMSTPPTYGALAAGAITNPIGTAIGAGLGIPTFKALDWLTQKGVESLPEGTSPEIRDILESAGQLGSYAVGGQVVRGMQKPATRVAKNISKTLYESIIRPKKAQLTYGKQPAEGLQREKISGSLNKMYRDTQIKIDALDTLTEQEALKSKNSIDASTIMQPLDKLMDNAARANNKTLLQQAYEAKQAIRNELSVGIDPKTGQAITVIKGSRNLENLPINEAIKLKRNINNIRGNIYNTPEGKGSPLVKALRQVYFQLNGKIGQKEPNLRVLNQRISNLISAKDSLNDRIKSMESRNVIQRLLGGGRLGGMLGLYLGRGSIPQAIGTGLALGLAEKVMASPITKTGIANWIYSPQE